MVKVKVLGFDDRGKVKLSMKQVDQATGEDLTKKEEEQGTRGSAAERRRRPALALPRVIGHRGARGQGAGEHVGQVSLRRPPGRRPGSNSTSN